MNDSVEENARMATWKRSVEQALRKAEAREPTRPPDAARTAEGSLETTVAVRQGEAMPIDLGLARELAKERAESSSAREAKGSAPSSGAYPAADDQNRQTGSASRPNGWSRQSETNMATMETDDREIARNNAIARHALTYSWVTTDRAGHRWMHIRPLRYGPRE
jgi:hypothetical protein